VHNTLICLVRHGVTEWNYEGRAQGRTDIPLNAEGLKQAELVAARLRPEPWDAIYSSSLSRARQTAEAIARATGHEVRQDPRLVERDMGFVEGYALYERSIRWPGTHLTDLPFVETDEAMAARAAGALREIAERHPGQRIVCVAHGGLIKAFLESLPRPEGAPALQVAVGNTSVARVRYDGARFAVEATPDNSHVLSDGLEFSGEKGRVQLSGLRDLAAMTGLPADRLEAAVILSTAVESAWSGHRLVGFARAFTDGVLAGYVDLTAAAPEHPHVLPDLIRRLQARFPGVSLSTTPLEIQERVGD
jgi:2,3-bisphosphoglycerate-dependent phosphoglycerate mutase